MKTQLSVFMLGKYKTFNTELCERAYDIPMIRSDCLDVYPALIKWESNPNPRAIKTSAAQKIWAYELRRHRLRSIQDFFFFFYLQMYILVNNP